MMRLVSMQTWVQSICRAAEVEGYKDKEDSGGDFSGRSTVEDEAPRR